jgi:hypothetical protein
MKKHKLESFDGIDHALVECHYSVARKRGPQPGSSKSPTAPRGSIPADGTTIYQQPAKKKPKKAKQAAPMMHDLAAMASAFGGGNLGQMPLPLDPAAAALQQQILSSLGAIGLGLYANFTAGGGSAMTAASNNARQQLAAVESLLSNNKSDVDSVTNPLSSEEEAHFRACYTLSVGSLFGLPDVLKKEDYFPKYDVAVLQAARFAELAIGALVDGNGSKMTKLANATVLCLKEAAQEPVHPSCKFDVARAYFFLAICELNIGDVEGYLKYRRESMRRLSEMNDASGADTLLAAMSLQDSFVYILYKGLEDTLPNIDYAFPPVNKPDSTNSFVSIAASNPLNQVWIQGIPPVYSKGTAPFKSRVNDAIACAIRSYVDEAASLKSDGASKGKSATALAVEGNQQLSCRRLVEEAIKILPDNSSPTVATHRFLLSALAVVVNANDGEISENQLQSTMNVLSNVLDRPALLYGGPTLHIVNDCAILLGRYINKLREEDALFQDELDLYNSARMCMRSHNNKIPSSLRCNELPRPNLGAMKSAVLIDFGGCSKELSELDKSVSEFDTNSNGLLATLSKSTAVDL